jgi:hypothetical protein
MDYSVNSWCCGLCYNSIYHLESTVLYDVPLVLRDGVREERGNTASFPNLIINYSQLNNLIRKERNSYSTVRKVFLQFVRISLLDSSVCRETLEKISFDNDNNILSLFHFQGQGAFIDSRRQ